MQRPCLPAQGCTGVPGIPMQAVPLMTYETQWLHGYSHCSQFYSHTGAGVQPRMQCALRGHMHARLSNLEKQDTYAVKLEMPWTPVHPCAVTYCMRVN